MFKKIIGSLLFVTSIASSASAANYAIFLHGRAENNWSGTWAAPSGYTLVDAVASWDGKARIDRESVDYNKIADMCSSAKGNNCVVYSYSTGGLIAQRMQLLRSDANPLYMNAFASAGGGSELADACGWVTQWGCYYGGVDDNLKPSWARNSANSLQYSRGQTKHIAGNGFAWSLGGATHPVVAGDDDGAVGPHSSEGCSRTDTDGNLNGCQTCTSRSWWGSCTSRSAFTKPGHTTFVRGGWNHFNILGSQSSYWY